MNNRRRILRSITLPLAPILLIGCLWPWTIHHCDQVIYRDVDGSTYALETHPHGLAFVWTSHGRQLDELWRPHEESLPGGLHFEHFAWGTLRTATYYGMSTLHGSDDAQVAVFTRTEVRHWEPPEHNFGGLGWGGERRTIGPPIPPVALTYERRVISVPFWAMMLILVYVPLLLLRRRYLASRPPRALPDRLPRLPRI